MNGTNASKTARAKRRRIHKLMRDYETVQRDATRLAAEAMALHEARKAKRGP